MSTGPLEFREMMRDYEDTKREYRELAAKCEALRQRVTELEGQCAAMRGALEKIAAGTTVPRGTSPAFLLSAGMAAGASHVEIARQVLQATAGAKGAAFGPKTPACGIKGHTTGGYDGEKWWCRECTEAVEAALDKEE